MNEEKSKSAKGELESQKKEKKEKKVYDLPGQKRDPPEEVLKNDLIGISFMFGSSLADHLHLLLIIQRDPLRIFYETLHKQVPHSEMAEFW